VINTATKVQIRKKGYEKALKNMPSDALRIVHKNEGHWYVFLCVECKEKELQRPAYYFTPEVRQKYQDVATRHCRRCSNSHNYDKKYRPFESLYEYLKGEASRWDISCVLTFEDFVAFTEIKECTYCGGPIKWYERRSARNGSCGYNLDRKDNQQGYTKENSVVCCPECNRVKSDRYTFEEMKVLGATLARIRQQENPE
jgi:hypothetical protein